MANKDLSGEFILSPEKINTQQEPAVTRPAPSTSREIRQEQENTNETSEESTRKHSKPHFYSAFAHYPDGFTFKDQENGEEVILLIRQHFITNLPWIVGFTLLGFFPPLFFFFAPLFLDSLLISPALLVITTLFYYLVLFAFAVLYFTLWYFNAGIITNKRIIDIDVPNILIRVLSEARLNAVQDVTITQVGGIRSIFNYGDVDIQTEAVRQNLEFYRVPQPNFIRTLVGNLVVHRK